MTTPPAGMEIRIAGARDVPSIAELRSLWDPAPSHDRDFEERLADWIAAEGSRRTTWLATLDGSAAGMASLFEYRRMPKPGRPDSRWGYVSNMFVREELRGRGIGSALLAAIVESAEARRYARLVLSPSERSVSLYRRAGFVVPDASAGEHGLLVRPGPT